MKKKKIYEKGITLIALVITIIVLLILAGVTLRIVFNGGIIEKSQNAVNKYKYESQSETDQLADLEDILKEYYYEKDDEAGKLKGQGTKEDPYVISSIEDLVAFSYNVNSGEKTYEGQTVSLGRSLFFDGSHDSYVDENAKYKEITNDDGDIIVYKPEENSNKTIKELVTTGKGFVPIGNIKGCSFKGNFDGNNYYISNIYINSTTGYVGLFGVIEVESTICNVGIKSGNITNNGGLYHAGGILGLSEQDITILNCYNNAIITSYSGTGGIVAYVKGKAKIINCYNSNTIEAQHVVAGGIVAYIDSTEVDCKIENCYNTGDVIALNCAGGIIGSVAANYSENITNCFNAGKVTSSGSPAGGIIGNASKANIINCYNDGIIESSYCAGGIAGTSSGGSISYCYNRNKVIGGSAPTGGIASYGTTVTNCYNIGEVTGAESLTGEIIGYGSVGANCYYNVRTKDGATTNVQPNDAKTMNDADINAIMDISNFVSELNSRVTTNNSDSSNIVWKTWRVKNGYPVFSN